jgi:YHS domain-containing protein/positive regulator of sigma E activity
MPFEGIPRSKVAVYACQARRGKMSESQGVVVDASEDGRAKVLLEASDPCIHCAEEVDVCNCSGASSRVIIRALNSSGASVGDLVSISRKPGALLKSITVFLVIPVLGLIPGLIISAVLNQRYTVNLSLTAIPALVGLLVGIAISVLVYRRVSADIQPFISRIISSGLKLPSSLRVMDPVCKMAVDPAMAAGRMSYRGKTYYFCREGCLKTFMGDPGRYVEA